MAWEILLIVISIFFLGFVVGMKFEHDMHLYHQQGNGIPDDKLKDLSENERYLVIGIEDGFIHADRKALPEYYKIYDRVMKG